VRNPKTEKTKNYQIWKEKTRQAEANGERAHCGAEAMA